MRRQHPIRGGRTALPACVIKEIREEVCRIANKYDVSRSFVISVALAEQFGIHNQEQYQGDQNVKRTRSRR